MIRCLVDWWYRWRHYMIREWAHVPPPNWRCSRGGRDFW